MQWMSDGCLMPNEKCSATSISWREEVIFNDYDDYVHFCTTPTHLVGFL